MNSVIIVGAGKGKRMKSKVNKILLSLADKPIIARTIEIFEKHKLIDNIALVINRDDKKEIENLIKRYNYKKIKNIAYGGEKRQDSVYNGLKSINAKEQDIILIHNAANPLIRENEITVSINEAKKYGASVCAFPARDTIKIADNGFVIKTLDRKKLWQMQTPQTAKYLLWKKAFKKAKADNFYGTDDVTLIERLGYKVKIVPCSEENIKITAKNDLDFVNKILRNGKVGFGQDSHKFTNKAKPLILAGVVIPNEKGLMANSDGDVVLHSLFNAISQSIGEKSLGYYADDMCKKGIKDSREYLKLILDKLKQKSYKINNVGIMIEARKPKIDMYEEKIKRSLSKLLNVKQDSIGITATSGEYLTPFGKGEAIQVFSIVSIRK